MYGRLFKTWSWVDVKMSTVILLLYQFILVEDHKDWWWSQIYCPDNMRNIIDNFLVSTKKLINPPLDLTYTCAFDLNSLGTPSVHTGDFCLAHYATSKTAAPARIWVCHRQRCDDLCNHVLFYIFILVIWRN